VNNPSTRDLSRDWPIALYDTLKAANVQHMSYVPDAGHTTLINLLTQDTEYRRRH